MSITNIRPEDCPVELRVRIERVMLKKKMSWREAVLFLALKVVSPTK